MGALFYSPVDFTDASDLNTLMQVWCIGEVNRWIKQRTLLVLLCFSVFFFVRSTIYRQPAGRFAPKFACGRTLVPDVSSPLLGVSGPRGRKRGKWNFRYYGSQWGIFFAFWWFWSDISATRGRIHTKFYTCRDNVCRCAPSPSVGSIAPNGGFVSVLLTHLFSFLFSFYTMFVLRIRLYNKYI